jgi:hypothetical protein
LDPLGWGGERDYLRVVVRGAQRQAAALVTSTGVVVLDEFIEDEVQVAVLVEYSATGLTCGFIEDMIRARARLRDLPAAEATTPTGSRT